MFLLLAFGLVFLACSALVAGRVVFAEQRERERAIAAAATYARPLPATRRRRVSAESIQRLLTTVLFEAWIRLNPKASEERMLVRLQNAGLSNRFTPRGFLATQFAVAILLLVFGFVVATSFIGALILGITFAVVAVYLSEFLLSRRASQRAEVMAAALPRVLDQLVISMEAGLGFDAAIAHIVSRGEGPLIDELRSMLGEMKVGESRARALKNLATRIPGEDIKMVVQAVVQSEQRGLSLTGILRAQAADLRHKRQQAAEEKAMKAPVKMLFPIVIFILPVMFVVILGPAFINTRGTGLFGG
jgi:tight adherence protein C